MRREFSAGGIVFKKFQETITKKQTRVWLVRRPKENAGYRGNLGWSFPKGWIDGGETVEQAALREVREEGGVEAKIIEKLPALKIFFTNNEGERVMKFITYFVMGWVGDAPEGVGWETEETKWVTAAQAREMLAFANEKKLLEEAERING